MLFSLFFTGRALDLFMFIAQQLRKQNIVEYLLYMWQIEDLIRAFEFDMDKVEKHIIAPYQLADGDKKKLYEWYESLISMMKDENVQEAGHLQLNKNVIIQLNDFHAEMMKSEKDASYNANFYKILPLLNQLRQSQPDSGISDIELCYNFLYGIMTLRLSKKEISPETQKAQTDFTKFLALLNKYYQLYVVGELSFEED